MTQGIPIVFGGAAIGRLFSDEAAVLPLFDALEKGGVKTIDSAQNYIGSEELLGKVQASKRFIIDTKAAGGNIPGALGRDKIVERAKESIRKLGGAQVDIFYIHSPDHSIPISETLAGINEIYEAGLFKRFGLSNYRAADVQAVYDHCKEQNYVLPTVYQGHYNPIARGSETSLFPTLRKLSIAFYAYSPLAGGFLAKSPEDIESGKGRFDPNTPIGKRMREHYANPKMYAILKVWADLAKKQGCSPSNLAYRWVTYNSPLTKENGDAIIIGARDIKQAVETLEGIKEGPLDKDVGDSIEELWKKIEAEAEAS